MGIKVVTPHRQKVTEISIGSESMSNRSRRISDLLDLQEATYTIPFMMASGGVVGRGVVGPGFDVVQADINSKGREAKRKKILDFFNYSPVVTRNIKDTFGPLAKLYTTAFMFRMYGHAAWQLIRNKENGRAIGFDIIPGIIRPNVDDSGNFKNPAYIQYLKSGRYVTKTEFASPDNVVFFCVPDFSTNIWLSETMSLTDYSLPSEVYAARAYKALHENRNAPYSGIWYTPPDIDDETFDRFVALINRRYTGASNFGRNPIIMRGEGGYKSISVPQEEAPYIEGRNLNRKEIGSVTGVPGPKYGVDIENTSGLAEIRREFYESTLRPVMSLLEEVIYIQICIKLFNAPEWKFKFSRPDFTTAVEDASIELRRIQWGQWSPNEARASRGEPPRDGGDYYLFPLNMSTQEPNLGRPDDDEVDEDSGALEPEEEDTVPGTEPAVVVEQLLSDLYKWKRFQKRVTSGQRVEREFVSDTIPKDFYNLLKGLISANKDDLQKIDEIFEDAIDIVKKGFNVK